jgi:Putative porin
LTIKLQYIIKYLTIVCILTGANNHFLMAQEAASSTSRPLVLPGEINPADTLPVQYVLVIDPATRHFANDTMPDGDFRMYDPARKQGIFDYAHLGNFGSAARPLGFAPLSRIGFETGMHAYDIYQLNPNNLRFYRHARTYSHAGFSRGRTQRDAASFIRLSRTFSGGLNFSLQYQTINNLGEYRFQRNKHSAFAAGIWWPIRKNYEIFLIYTANTNQSENNGGITSTAFFASDLFTQPISVPVLFESEAKNKFKRGDLQLTQYTTIGKARNQLQLAHTLNYITESWKFSDKNIPVVDDTTQEEIFYAPYLKDIRGVRHYYDLQRLNNHVTVSTLRKKKNNSEAGRITVGIRHSFINLYREPLPDSIVNNLFLTGKLAIKPTERMAIVGDGDLGILANTGEYRLQGTLLLDLGKIGILRANLLSQRRPPDLIHARLISAANPIWSNSFNKVVENSISATYDIPSIGFQASAANHIVNNYLYFNQLGLPMQSGRPIQVSQLAARQSFHFGRLHSENTVALQQINNKAVVRLPNWFSKNSLYVEGRLFKKQLLANAGVDFRINSAFQPDAYQPMIGQFQLQDSFEQKPYPWLDAFLSVKIQTFRLYFRFENMAPLWNKTSNLYLTTNHPQNRASFRIGISWRFLDNNVAGQEQENGGNNGGGSNGPPPGVGSRGRGL